MADAAAAAQAEEARLAAFRLERDRKREAKANAAAKTADGGGKKDDDGDKRNGGANRGGKVNGILLSKFAELMK